MAMPPVWRLEQNSFFNDEYFTIINDAGPGYIFSNDNYGSAIITWCFENVHRDDWFIDTSHKLFIKSKYLSFFMLSLSDVLNRRPWE